MFKNIAKALGGDPLKKELDRLGAEIEKINALEDHFENLDNQTLSAKSGEFRQRLADGQTMEEILPEAFAAVREASKRTTGLRHYDIQLIGGMVLHEGKIAEMRTGEGKTLVATLPLYLNALTGKGVHLVTVNDYLARRDARWMAPIFNLLGLNVGVLQMSSRTENARSAFLVDLNLRDPRDENDQLRLVPRADAYRADITYGTNHEFGFDYLRDNLVMDIRQRVQRGYHYAIIDEVDNILIDEARTPLIISGQASEDVEWYSRMAAVVRQLEPEDYDLDEKDRSIALTEIGEAHVEDLLKIPLRDPDRPEDITPEQARLLGYLEQALRAQLLFYKNKDYIVQNGQVVIVDEFTGRLMPGRRWSEGLHQAVEAKEGVKVNPENVTHATITLQNYFRKYEKLSGMTGTAVTEAEEFSTIYGLDVVEIPTNLDFEAQKPSSDLVTLEAKDNEGYPYIYYSLKEDQLKKSVFWKRKDYPDVVYRSIEGKLRAIVLEILRLFVIGRPQLIGTTSIEHSEQLSARLHAESIRRLAMVTLIRETYFREHQINVPERGIPDLDFLNRPLSEIKPDEMRRFAVTTGMDSINPESPENLIVIRDYLSLDEHHLDRLKEVLIGGIPHQVLNALKHDQESQIIADAGAFGAVTIATNMAGRGVDIKLGGEIHESILSDVRKALNISGKQPYGMTNAEIAAALKQIPSQDVEEFHESIHSFFAYLENMKLVRQAGGLHVIGSERHEARRIDNQLRGRSARQGDPGSSRFYLSLEDDLMRMFGGERAESMMKLFNIDPSVPLESRMLGRLVEQAQERVEGYNFDIRKHLLEYDDVLNDQRERIYKERDRVLMKVNLEEDVLEMLESELKRRVPESMEDPEGHWKLLAFLDEIQPTMFFSQQSARIPSYTMSVISNLIQKKVPKSAKMEEISKAALEIARLSLEAEKYHLVAQTGAFIQRTGESFNNQLAERLELLDIFLDNLESYSEASARELADLLQNQVRIKVALNQELASGLRDRSESAREAISSQIEKQLAAIFLSRMQMSIERRLGGRVGVDINALADKDWLTIEQVYQDGIEKVFKERMEEIIGPASQILHNIQTILSKQDDMSTVDLVELAAGMPQGTQAVIDPRTRQRMNRRVNLFNYIFLAAQEFEGKNADEILSDILTHLKNAGKQLLFVWGRMELQRLTQENSLEVQSDFLSRLERVKPFLSENEFKELNPVTLQDAMNQENEQITSAFGRQVQNTIYRHILLRAISDLWIEHLTQMEALRVSIRMEAYAQRDPLVQYKSESTDRFKDLLASIRLGVISQMFRLQPAFPRQQTAEPPPEPNIKSSQSDSGNSKKKRKRHKK